MFAADNRESAKTKVWLASGKATSQSAAPASTQNPVWRRLATFVQTKLAVSALDDPYEREAELVAEQALQASAPAIPCACAGGGTGGTACPKCEERNDLTLRRQAEGAGAGTVAADGLLSHLGAGRPLDQATRVFMETRLARDFSQVRVHTDCRAAESAQAINALAYTFGNNIVFKEGQYAPETEKGKRILAHELAHVAQQGRGRLAQVMRIPNKGGINDTPPRYSYSTNCGWIDWSHANPGMTHALIRAVQDASDRMAASGSTTPELVAAPSMKAGVPHLGTLLSGVTPIAHIKKPLTPDEVLSVALRIFMLQSLGFEALQDWTEMFGSSSFSEEDLPSNLIAFYRAARGFDRPRIETACGVWDAASSLTKFQGYPFQKVRQFRPLSLPPGGAWPADLSTITPAVTGGPLLDTPEGRFETTHLSFTRGLVGYEIITNPSLHIESLSGGTTIDISGTTPGSAHGPHFEVRPLPGSHNLRCRWIIKAPHDKSFLMLGNDESSVFQFGSQFNAFINAPSRQALRDAGITSATILCRVTVGNVGEKAAMQRLLELPVTFTW